jgi:DNA segregation ATPase FtsK/SpoIIIE, S-DNA-T family
MFKLPSFKLPSIIPKLQMDKQSEFTLWIVACVAFGIEIYFSLIDWAGSFGGMVGTFIRTLMGRGAVFIPIFLFVTAVLLIRYQRRKYEPEELNSRFFWGIATMVWAICGYINLFNWVEIGSPALSYEGGGLFGYILYPGLTGFFGSYGGFVMLFFIFMLGFFSFSQMTPYDFLEKLKLLPSKPELIWDFIPDVFEFWRKQTNENIETKEAVKDFESVDLKTNLSTPESIISKIKDSSIDIKVPEKAKSVVKSTNTTETVGNQPQPQEIFTLTGGSIKWIFPKFELLNARVGESDPGDIKANVAKIENTLRSFGIETEMKVTVQGPTVSQYTLKPNSGVKLSSIETLSSNLAMELAASSIRIEAPIAGTSLVGIEIPNKKKATVRLRDLVQTQEFKKFKDDLPIVIGLDVAGRNVIYSLAKMPHLLVAGSTGAGKSVWINNMLLCLLYRYSPEDLQLLLMDMKKVELTPYNGIPHLLAPVITVAEKAINSLKWSVIEMERRYKLLEEFGKRNIIDYNKYIRENKPEDQKELPYIVIVIDELGDLIMLAKNEVEPIIVRLTQMSRAVGIHLVLGTQRPDTQVVTGLIKANVPTRIAFAVASGIDSRVILDQIGAEKLLGAGDGMIMSPNTMKAVRFQGAYVDEEEVTKVVSFVKGQVGNNTFLINHRPEITEPPRVKIVVPGMKMAGSDYQNENDTIVDEVYDRAKEIAFIKGAVSTSMLQTSLGIGYPRARKFIELMEEEGCVGPSNGSKPREVFPPDDWIQQF